MVFEMPLIMSSIVYLGIVDVKMLQEKWRYAVAGSFIIALMISPGASTLTVSVNGSFSYNDYPFVNIVDLPLVLNVSKDTPLIITVHSDSLNYTRILYYRADVKTNVEL